jgi:glycine/D-amino acid oxidase-like deaminating enzyme
VTKQVIIIGSGIVGSAIAWHLAKAGAQVTVLDSGPSGGIATAGSWAWLNASWGNALPYFRLRERALLAWRRIDKEVPGLEVRWCGGLLWDLPPDELEAFAREHASWGYGIRRVGREEIAQLEPNLNNPPDFALHVAEEGQVEPLDAARALLAGAVQLGARLLDHTPVKWLIEQSGTVRGVAIDDGALHADEVVIAAGLGAAGLTESIGFKIGLEGPPGLLVYSTPLGEVLNGLLMAPDFHVKQSRTGSLVAGSDFAGGFDEDDAEGAAERLHAKVISAIAGAERAGLHSHRVTQRPTPIDGLPMIGRLPGLEGAFLAVMHSGVTLAPAVGQFAADEILDGRRDNLLAPFAPDRLTARL